MVQGVGDLEIEIELSGEANEVRLTFLGAPACAIGFGCVAESIGEQGFGCIWTIRCFVFHNPLAYTYAWTRSKVSSRLAIAYPSIRHLRR